MGRLETRISKQEAATACAEQWWTFKIGNYYTEDSFEQKKDEQHISMGNSRWATGVDAKLKKKVAEAAKWVKLGLSEAEDLKTCLSLFEEDLHRSILTQQTVEIMEPTLKVLNDLAEYLADVCDAGWILAAAADTQ